MVTGTAWLERVLITPTHMDVIVRGRDVSGTRVELNSATYRADARVSDTGEVRIPLPDGLITPGSKNSPLEFYIRRGATTFPARPEEIRNAVLAHNPALTVPTDPWSSG